MEIFTQRDFQWINQSRATVGDEALTLYAPSKSDFFFRSRVDADPAHAPGATFTAPFYYTEVSGDFVLKAEVSLAFVDTFDSAALMVMADPLVWAKACFEKTDFGTNAAVSVVTNHVSDDANGCNIAGESLWLQAARAGSHFAFHYSLDGVRYDMMRFFTLPPAPL